MSEQEPEVWGGGCECWVTDEKHWLSAASCGYGGGYEPGSQVEFNPDCPMHGQHRRNRRDGDEGGGGEMSETSGAAEERAVQLLLAAARELAVIDPGDAEQVERLAKFYGESFGALRKVQPADQTGVKHVDMMAWALRRYADPGAEWRPDEPQDVGAVVEDAEGNIYVRHVVIANATPWRLSDEDWRSWDQIPSVTAIRSWGAPGISETATPPTPEPTTETSDERTA